MFGPTIFNVLRFTRVKLVSGEEINARLVAVTLMTESRGWFNWVATSPSIVSSRAERSSWCDDAFSRTPDEKDENFRRNKIFQRIYTSSSPRITEICLSSHVGSGTRKRPVSRRHLVHTVPDSVLKAPSSSRQKVEPSRRQPNPNGDEVEGMLEGQQWLCQFQQWSASGLEQTVACTDEKTGEFKLYRVLHNRLSP